MTWYDIGGGDRIWIGTPTVKTDKDIEEDREAEHPEEVDQEEIETGENIENAIENEQP